MADNQTMTQQVSSKATGRRDRQRNERPTIAFLSGLLGAELIYEKWQMWRGISQAARSREVNLLYVAGGGLSSLQAVLYELLGAHTVDGLISWNSFVTFQSTMEEIREFFMRRRPLPVVNIELDLEGFPSVMLDNTQGVRDVLAHLIEVHGCHRIVYLASATGSPNILRRQAYQEVMAGYGLYDPGLDFFEVDDLMRSLRPGVDYQAIVTAVDGTAIQAADALRARGVRVPGDVAVTGFNDGWEARFVSPPLTTVRLPFYEMGWQATEMLLDMIAGRTIREQVFVPLELVVRRSCGCFSTAVVRAAAKPAGMLGEPAGALSVRGDQTFEAILHAQRNSILLAMRQAADLPAGPGGQRWDERLFDAFVVDLVSEAPVEATNTFVPLLENLSSWMARSGGSVNVLHEAISALRREVLPLLGRAGAPWRDRAEDLWQQARVLIGETTLGAQMYRTWRLEGLSNRVSGIGQAMAATGTMAGLLDVLARDLPSLGIASGYLALYEPDSGQQDAGVPHLAEWSRLVLAFDPSGRKLDETAHGEGKRFASKELLPSGLLRRDRPYQMIVQSLDFRDKWQGFTLFEIDAPESIQEAIILETLREQIGNALRAVLLFQEQEQSRLEAEAARRQLEVAVRDLQAAQRQYLDQRWTGYVSSQAAQGYVLSGSQAEPMMRPVSSEEWLPVMGEAVERGEMVVQSDEQGGSMLGVPVVLSGEIVGVLGGLSTQVEGWSEDDLAMVKTIVEQIALTLETQRLEEEQRQARALLDRRVKALDFVNELGRRIEESTPSPDLLAWLAARMPSQMQYPDLCRVAIRLGDQVYGTAGAIDLPDQIAQGLRIGGEPVGQIHVAYTEARDFVDEESALLGDVARRLSGYIESRRLLEETRASAEELSTLYQLGQALSARLDLGQVLDLVYQGVSRLLDARNFYIGLYDPQKHEIAFPLDVTESVVDKHITTVSADQGLSGYIVRTAQSVLIEEDVAGWLKGHHIEAVGEAAQSWLGVPLLIGGQVQGVMAIQNYARSHAYDEADRARLEAIAGQASIAIQNARLFEQAQRRVQQLAVLNEIGRAASGLPESQALLMAVYEQLGRVLNLDVFFVANLEADANVDSVHPTVSFPIFYDGGQRYEIDLSSVQAESNIGRVLRSGEPVFTLRTQEQIEQTGPTQTMALGDTTRRSASLMYVPMKVGDQVVGVMSAQSYTLNAYSQDDLNLLVGAANQVAVALQSARLFEQTQEHARREQILREITVRLRGSISPDAIVRTAVRELSTALGRRAFVRLGSAEQLSEPPTKRVPQEGGE